METEETTISIVVPAYNEQSVLSEFHRRVSAVLDTLPMHGELVYVNDGSRDETLNVMKALQSMDSRVLVVDLSRNYGKEIALTAGLDYARGDIVVPIDADLQDPPELIPDMVEKWQEGYDVVYGVRKRRVGESRMKLWTAAAFYRLLRSFTNIEIPVDVGDFRLISGRAAVYLRQLREKDRFVRGLVSWVGFRQVGLPYERDPRLAGETKYPFSKMFKFAIDGITSFSNLPLKLASWLGYLASFLAFIYLARGFVQRAMGHTIEGWATIMVAMLFLGGVQLICIGIIGEYIGRIFNETKSRPLYVIESIHGGGTEQRPDTDYNNE